MNRSLQSIRWSKAIAFTVFLLWMIPEQLLAQDRTITGTVKAADDKSGLPGANIFVEGTTKGTSTDAEGHFSLEVSEGSTLVFSSIGYTTQKVAITTQTVIDVVLEVDAASLQEVVVVGYATVERRDLTSSVSSINAKQLKDIPINSAAQALSGRLAGVQVTTSEGSPNAQVTIRVRGGGSITQDNSPLYVVDGVQVENALSVLAPQDIQSIDVLKDASATAIYGARGANGVVIITTKGGKEMKTTVTYNGLIGVRKVANELDVMKPYDYAMFQYERSRASTLLSDNFLKTYGTYQDLELYKQVPNTDWQKQVFGRDAVMQTHNVSVQGGNANTQFNLSVSSNKEEGVMVNSDFNRKLINFRFDTKVNDRVKVGFSVRYNNTVVNGIGTSDPSSSGTNRLRQSVKYTPILFPGQSTDTYDADYAQITAGNGLNLVNPILLSRAEYKKDKSSVANFTGNASIDITKFLNFKTTLGVDLTNQRINTFNDTITAVSISFAKKPLASINTISKSILNNSNVLTFSATRALGGTFAERNKLDIMIGQEIYETVQNTDYLESHLFPLGISPERAFANMSLGTPQIPTSNQVTSHLLSFFGRLSYSYDDRFMLSLTMRADGSSKFAQGHKWGQFPSASLAWRISNEKFMESLTSTFSNLKIRASYGQSGNNRIGDFLYLAQFQPNAYYDMNNVLVTGYNSSGLANNNLKWETTESKNIGLDMGVLNDRVQLSIDFYNNSTKDLLLNAVVPVSSGYSNQIQNIGSTSNRGVEVQLTATPVQRANANWTVNFNISSNRNRIESLGGQSSFTYPSGWANAVPNDFLVQVGQPVGTIWGYVVDGFYKTDDFDYANGVYTLKTDVVNDAGILGTAPQPGSIKFKDLNGDNQINVNDDRTIIGNTTPKFFGGLNNQVNYKNFDLSLFVNFQYGNKVLNANKLEFTSSYTVNSNVLSIMNNRWRTVDPGTGQVVKDPEALNQLNANATLWSPIPTAAASFSSNSWAVEDGSFIRINNITLGYSLPTSLLNVLKITKLRFYGTVNNLAVFTKYSGYDPDVNTRRSTPLTPGVDYSAYPKSHAYIFGVNLSF